MLEICKRPSTYAPTNAADHVALGLAHYTAGRDPKTRSSTFERVPSFSRISRAFQNLGTAHHMLGHPDQAFQRVSACQRPAANRDGPL